VCFAIVAAICAAPPEGATPNAAGRWLAGVVEPITTADGAWIDPYIDGQRVVLIGEEVHGVAEHIDLKIELALRLVDNHAFTHIAIEDDVFKADRLQQGGVDALDAFYWCWNIAELARGLNALAARTPPPVLTGFDVQSPDSALATLNAIADSDAQRNAVDSAAAVFADDRNAYAARSAAVHEADIGTIASLRAAFPDGRAERAVRHLLRVQSVWAVAAEHGPRMNARDAGMAQSILDILNEDPRHKVVVFAHNAHAGYAPFYESFTGGVIPLGRHLRDALPGATLSIGAVFATGSILLDPRQREDNGGPVRIIDAPPHESQAAAWMEIPAERWLLDPERIRAASPPDAVRAFLTAPPAGHFDNYGPARALDDAYDLIVGYRTVRPATPNR
jgi:erythromycin esterase-like protein